MKRAFYAATAFMTTSKARLFLTILLIFGGNFSLSADDLLKELNNLHYQLDGFNTDTSKLEREYLNLLKQYKDPVDIGRIYASLTDMYSQSGLTEPYAAAKYAEIALQEAQNPAQQIKLHFQWGDALQVQNRGVTGAKLAEVRRAVAIPYLKGMKIALDNDAPENPVPFPTRTTGRYSGPPGTEEHQRFLTEVKEQEAGIERAQLINSMVENAKIAERQVVFIYTRKPYDSGELRQIAGDILEDEMAVEKLMAKVDMAIQGRTVKEVEKMGSQIARELLPPALQTPVPISAFSMSAQSNESMLGDFDSDLDHTYRGEGDSSGKVVFTWMRLLSLSAGVVFVGAAIIGIQMKRRLYRHSKIVNGKWRHR